MCVCVCVKGCGKGDLSGGQRAVVWVMACKFSVVQCMCTADYKKIELYSTVLCILGQQGHDKSGLQRNIPYLW